VLGASADALEFVQEKFEIEMNSATDNPLVFAESGRGALWGELSRSDLGVLLRAVGASRRRDRNFSERRIALLLEAPDLPKFLVSESGLNSGLMVPQYTAAALVAENKVLAHPASVDSIPTSGGKEDHNSMATISAHKALQIVRNVETIVAIELLTVRQALSSVTPALMAHAPAPSINAFLSISPRWKKIVSLQYDIHRAIN
jgi:histidine ammonia-lyase